MHQENRHPTRKISVLVVDDSLSVRTSLIAGLSADPYIEVVGFANDGIEALAQVKALKPDVVTLDVEMPRLDGLGALERIMAEHPMPVIMVSSLTRKGAKVTVRALELGALDFVLKTKPRGSTAVKGLITELREKIHQATAAKITGTAAGAMENAQHTHPQPSGSKTRAWQKRVVVIASSTGGPRALRTVIPSLPADLPVPVLVVQHLPPNFTAMLADSLNSASQLAVEEARPGVELSAGRVLVAPGGVHMEVSTAGSIRLNLADHECGVRPSVNRTMESVASVYGASSVGVVLTGMGSDGTRGAGLIKKAGGRVIAEAESTCVIYGMPKSVAEAGHADDVVPLPHIAAAIVQACTAEPQREELRV